MELPEELLRIAAAGFTQGTVLFWKGYPFSDGTVGDKMVLLLSDCVGDKCYVTVLPTSQIQHYITGRRELVDTICFPKGDSTWFDRDTVVDLKRIKEVSVEDLAPHVISGAATKLGNLDEADMAKIIDAVKNAETLSLRVQQDILRDD